MPRRRGLVLALLGAGVLFGFAAPKDTTPPTAEPNPNIRPAGNLDGGVLKVSLEVRMARWYPDDDGGNSLLLPVFAEEGRAPQVPSPLLRMPAGTQVQVTLRNDLKQKVTVFGLHTRPAASAVPIELEPGATREVSFSAGSPGTYHYYAISDPAVKKMSDGSRGRWYEDGALSGAFIVDDPAAPPARDRVWVLNIVNLRKSMILDEEHEVLTINGKAWPYTERITAHEGEPLHWRVVNSTPSEHPMHLHGAYFTVTGVGDAERYTRYATGDQRTVVTEYMLPSSTFEMTWTPLAAGGWLFHCHYMLHMVPELAVPTLVRATGHAHTATLPKSAGRLDTHGMGGLVLAVNVEPSLSAKPTAPRGRARQLELIIDAGEGPKAGIVSTVREVSTGATSSSSPGPLLLLRRGEPVDIKVINNLKEPTAIHWHGIELESYFDGVPGIGSLSGQVTPTIPPGETFMARMTPPRAGTFIYHTHWAHETQLTGGLYGGLLVLERAEKFDAERQKVFVVGTGEVSWITTEVLLNGARQPEPLSLRRGRTYRLRFINIAPNQDITVSLSAGAEDLEWKAVAKDGFELPSHQRRTGKARFLFSVGETYDFEFTPATTGTYQLRVKTEFSDDPAAQAVADVHVR